MPGLDRNPRKTWRTGEVWFGDAMGLLDDAIREHLELKRFGGADPSEVIRQEQEALGPVFRGDDATHGEHGAAPRSALQHGRTMPLAGERPIQTRTSRTGARRRWSWTCKQSWGWSRASTRFTQSRLPRHRRGARSYPAPPPREAASQAASPSGGCRMQATSTSADPPARGGQSAVTSSSTHENHKAEMQESQSPCSAHMARRACNSIASTRTTVRSLRATLESLILALDSVDPGAIAQLGERLLCKQEVAGSIPAGSINTCK